jgi:fibronectin-binding autotransporter adhesin
MKAYPNSLLGTLAVIAISQGAQADTYDWIGGTGTWDTATANWTGFATTWPATSTTNDDAVFTGTVGTVTIATGGITANDLTFNADGYTLSGAGITLDGTTPTLTTAEATATTISSILSGAAGLTKTGTGDLILSGANNYTGLTNINAGTLIAGNPAALGSNTNGTTVAANASLDVGGQNLGTEVVTISGSGAFGDGAIVNSGVQQINALGRIVMDGNATVGGGGRWDLRNSAPTLDMAGFTLTKTGSIYLGLVGATISNPGNVIVNQGELNLTFGSTFGGVASTNNITVNSTGTLGFFQSSPVHGSTLNLNDGSTLRGENGSGTQNTWAGPINVAGEVTLQADGNSTTTTHVLNLPNTITGAANLTKAGFGNVILGGNNSITGTSLAINGGSVIMNHANAIGSISNITVSSAVAKSALVLGNNLTVGSGRTLTIAGAGANQFFGALAAATGNTGTSEWQGDVIIGDLTGTRIGSLGGVLHISGNISETNAGSALAIRNDENVNGTVTLSGNNAHSGTTTLSAAGLRIGSATALGSGPFVVDNGTRIASITSTDSTPRTITNATTLNGGTGVLTLGDATRNGKLTFSNTLALGTAVRPVAVGSEVEFAGIVSGALGGITKSGAGTLILSGNNSYTGATTVGAGTLKLDHTTNNGSKLADGAALILAGGTLELAGDSLAPELVSGTTLNANTASTITRPSGGTVLEMNAITRNSGASINFVQGGIATTNTPNNTSGILGAWATVGGTDWAVNSTNLADGPITALSSYTLSSTAGNAAGTYATAHITVDSNQTPDAAITPHSLRFNGPEANTLTLQGANSIASGGILVTTGTGSNPSTISGGTLTGPVNGDLFIQQNNPSGNLEIASQIINNTATSVVKSGVGSVTLSGANTYTGLTSILGGTLKAGSNSVFTNKGGLSMTGTSVLDLNGFNATFTTLASAATNVITNSSSATAPSNASAVGTPADVSVYVDALTFSTAGQTIASQVTDGATRKTQLVINNAASATNLAGITNTANNFSGGLVLLNTLSGTRLRINSAITGTPFGTGPIIIGQAATDKAQILLDSTAAITLANDVFVNTAVGSDAPGAFRVDTAGHTLSGKITANLAPARFATGTGRTASVNVTGQVTGSNGLTLEAGPATSVLTVTLNNGTANPNNYLGNTIINPAAATGRSSTLRLGAANQIPSGIGAGDVAISTVGTGVGTLDLNGFDEQINGLSGNGTVDGNVAGTAGSNTLTVGDEDATGAANTFSGTIRNTLGTLALTKIGTGRLILSGANSYSGPTLISGGTLQIGAGGTTGSILLGSAITNNGTLAFNRSDTLTQGTNFANDISGTGVLTKLGTGTLVLSAANSYQGSTLFGTAVGTSTGILRLANSSALGSGKLIINNGNADTGTVELTGGINLANNIDFFGRSSSGTAAIIRNVSGDNTLNGVLTGSFNGGQYNFHSDAGTLTISNKITTGNTGRALNLRGLGAINITGVIEDGTGSIAVRTLDAGTYTLSGPNTYTRNTEVATSTALTLASTGQLRFVPTTTGTTNAVVGAGTFNANGTFLLDLSGANTTAGNSWLLVDVSTLTESFGGTFTVNSSLGAFSETSPGIWKITSSGKTWTFTESTGTLGVADASGDDYATWANTFTPPAGLPGADDDGDGLTNFEEYAFGLDPKSGSSVSPITQQLNKADGTFKYTRRATPATTGVTYTYESSTTLSGTWPNFTPVSEVSNNATPVEEITVTIPGAPLTDPKFFIRVNAVKP